MAYTTNESGVFQVVVQPFPNPSEGKWQISTDGGSRPRWAQGGNELYYQDATGAIVRVQITTDPEFEVGEFVRLYETFGGGWDMTPDGQRVLMRDPDVMESLTTAPDTRSYPITVILDWISLLENQ